MTFRARGSLYVTMVATLAALHIVLPYARPLVAFRRMSIVMEPLEGIIGGPYLGFLAAAIGWICGRFIRPDSFWIENLFGIAEAVGALGAGFLMSRKWLSHSWDLRSTTVGLSRASAGEAYSLVDALGHISGSRPSSPLILENFRPGEKDVIIIAGADTERLAEDGARAAAWTLLK